jgi:excisionase family DNA binding protein
LLTVISRQQLTPLPNEIATMNPLLSQRDAARLLGLSVRTLERWRVQGEMLRFVKLGNSVRYRLEDIERFVAARVVGSTSENANDHQ